MCSCDSEDSCTHKITVYVKYSETAAPLVEGSVDSEEEDGRERREDTIIHCDNDTITICDTRVRLRLCPALPTNTRRQGGNRDTAESQFIPVKRKDLFKLLGLNESSDILDPSEEADAKKVALQNFLSSAVDKALFNIILYNLEKLAVSSPVTARSFLYRIIEHFSQNDKTSKKNGILLAPKQGKKNLAKFLGIDMSALAEAEHGAPGLPGKMGIFLVSVRS